MVRKTKKYLVFLILFILISSILSACVEGEDVSFNNEDEKWES